MSQSYAQPVDGLPVAGSAAMPYPAAAYPAGAYPVAVAQPDRFTRAMTRLYQRFPVWSAPLMVSLCVAGGVTYTLVMNPTDAGAFSSPTCIVKLTTGFDCPGCGGTRACWYLLHGNVAAAARSHLMVAFAAPYLVYLYVVWAANLMFKWRLPQLRISPKAVSFFLAAWGIFSILRNLPWAPFTWFYV